MDLAERLHMTLNELLTNADSQELGLWLARDELKGKAQAEQARLDALAARAEAALSKRR